MKNCQAEVCLDQSRRLRLLTRNDEKPNLIIVLLFIENNEKIGCRTFFKKPFVWFHIPAPSKVDFVIGMMS